MVKTLFIIGSVGLGLLIGSVVSSSSDPFCSGEVKSRFTSYAYPPDHPDLNPQGPALLPEQAADAAIQETLERFDADGPGFEHRTVIDVSTDRTVLEITRDGRNVAAFELQEIAPGKIVANPQTFCLDGDGNPDPSLDVSEHSLFNPALDGEDD